MIFSQDQLSVWKLEEMIDWSVHGLSIYGTMKQPIACYNLNAIIFLALPESSSLELYFLKLFCFQRIAKNIQQDLLWTEMLRILVEIVELQ